MEFVYIVYEDMYEESDLICVPSTVFERISQLAQEFLNWLPDAGDPEYYEYTNGRKVIVCTTDGFVKWLNSYVCNHPMVCQVVSRGIPCKYDHKIVEF